MNVSLTEAAAARLTELIGRAADIKGLRVAVVGGGCSGYRYSMMLEDAPTAADLECSAGGGHIFVDPRSAKLIDGSRIDYLDTLMGAGFSVDNPNAVAACGCGSSFRTAGGASAPGACGH